MSRKDYRAIAAIIADMEKTSDIIRLTIKMAELFKKDNPNFQFSTFYSACGLEGY